MKSDSLPKGFPDSLSAWEHLIAKAPGEDREPTAEEAAAFARGITTFSRDEFMARRAERRGRGPNRAPVKERVTIRLSKEVVAHFRATGAGWQGRIDAALKEWVNRVTPAVK